MLLSQCMPHQSSFLASLSPGEARLPVQGREEQEPLRTQQPVIVVVARDIERVRPLRGRRILHQAARRVEVAGGRVEVLQRRILAPLNPCRNRVTALTIHTSDPRAGLGSLH